MLFEPLWELFAARLFCLPSSDRLFNQYRDEDPALDRAGAAAVRRENLSAFLGSFLAPPAMLVVSEAAGHRGGRFTGIPLVSERMLVAGGTQGITGRPTSLGGPFAEATATIFRRVMGTAGLSPFIWNAVPLHPHQPGLPLTNRTPTRSEINVFSPLLGDVIRLVRPRLVVAMGRQAERSLDAISIDHVAVRHPANGGAAAFEQGMRLALAELQRRTLSGAPPLH